jgi:hypothetical protein
MLNISTYREFIIEVVPVVSGPRPVFASGLGERIQIQANGRVVHMTRSGPLSGWTTRIWRSPMAFVHDVPSRRALIDVMRRARHA